LAAPHTPVLLEEVLEWLRIRPEGTYIDATLGAGGHSEAIARRLTSGRLISLDRDAQALDLARERLKIFREKVTLVHSPFSRIAEVAQELGIPLVDGVLADLGVSSMQLDQAARGFSFREAAPLDMRMDSASEEQTADEIVNRWSEKEIADLLYREADEHDSRRIAKAIVRARPLREAETASRNKNVSGAADSGESRDGGTRAVSFSDPRHNKFRSPLGGAELPLTGRPPGKACVSRGRASRDAPLADETRDPAH